MLRLSPWLLSLMRAVCGDCLMPVEAFLFYFDIINDLAVSLFALHMRERRIGGCAIHRGSESWAPSSSSS